MRLGSGGLGRFRNVLKLSGIGGSMERLLGTLGFVPEGSGRSEGAVRDRVREGFIKQLGGQLVDMFPLARGFRAPSCCGLGF